MNLPEDALALLRERGSSVDPGALLTGPELADLLATIARSEVLSPHVLFEHRVLRIARHSFARDEHAGHPLRSDLPFRILVETPMGERIVEADAVLDASGVYGHPVPLVVPGAAQLEGLTARTLGELHACLPELSGRRALLVGHGHSVANALLVLDDLADAQRPSLVTWATRSRNLRPFPVVPSDPLPERDRVLTRANALAQKPPPWLRVERNASLESFARVAGGVSIALSGGRALEIDLVIALVGYRPDLDMISELPIEIAPATEGAAGVARALANVADCLSIPKVSLQDLASGEPRFFMIGAKSYGRAPTFLLQTGRAQVETILDELASSRPLAAAR
jgi:hypothetical protein